MRSFVVLIMLSLAVSACDGASPAEGPTDAELTLELQERFSSRLRDPDSVQFKELAISRASGNPILCGQYNAKNGFGGYTGYERFIAGPSYQVSEGEMANGEMDLAWIEFCGDGPAAAQTVRSKQEKEAAEAAAAAMKAVEDAVREAEAAQTP